MKNYGSRLLLILVVTGLCVWAVARYGIKLGLDLAGGSSLTYRLAAEGGVTKEKVDQAIDVIDKRLDGLGVSEVFIASTSADELVVEMPGRSKEETQAIKSLIERNGELQFRIVAEAGTMLEHREGRDANPELYRTPAQFRWFAARSGPDPDKLVKTPEVPLQQDLAALTARGAPPGEVLTAERALAEMEKAEVFRGEDLARTYVTRKGAEIVVAFEMRPERKSDFAAFTRRNVGQHMAIILDGTIQSDPVIEDELPGEGVISGGGTAGFARQEAADLVIVLQSGSTGVRLEIIREETLGPSLGAVAIETGKRSILLGYLAVVAVVLWYYRVPGLVANLALLLNIVITLGAMAFFRGALSLPGIAGILLTVGMSVDANILIFERLRDERRRGKGLEESLAAGYDRAMSAIIDGNVTAVLTAVVLIFMGSGAVRGFGVTLTIGLTASMFTAIFVTRTIFHALLDNKVLKDLRIGPDPKQPKLDYMKNRRAFTMPSIAIMAASLVAFLSRDEAESKDIEFAGGQQAVVQMRQAMPADEFQTIAQGPAKEWESATPVRLVPEGISAPADGSTNRYQVRVKARSEEEGTKYLEYLRTALGDRLMDPPYSEWTEEPAPGGATTSRVSFVLRTATPVESAEMLQAAFAAAGVGNPQVAPVEGSEGRAFRVSCDSVGTSGASEAAIRDRIRKAARAADPPVVLSDPMPSTAFLSPSRAEELWRDALKAVLLSLAIQVLYIRIRFADYTHGFAAVLALVHDTVVALGFVAVFDATGLVYAKINLVLIAAFLTLIGYSMNDTIVIFDRIRENLGRSRVVRSRIINDSVNQTIVRSLRTALVTFVVVVVQFALNRGMGSVLEGFAWVMVVGCIAGSYSTIFIAAPILLFLPGYGRILTANRTRFTVQVVATIVGLIVGITAKGHGAAMWSGVMLAMNLPLHFLWYFVPWLSHPDPDSLVQDQIDAEEHDRPLAAPGI